MSNTPADLKYSKSHEWARLENDGSVTVGITDHAQELLGDLVFIELPEVGRLVNAEEAIAVVESVKAASDIYAPMAGTVSAVNQPAADSPELVNDDAYDAWLFKLTPADPAGYQGLLSAADYEKLISG